MIPPFRLGSKVVVATHHKAGTFYCESVFAQMCREFGWTFSCLQRRRQPDAWDIAFHADATPERLAGVLGSGSKLLHVIRHPKSLIVSGVRYHLDAEEAWLDRPQGRFDGRSYRQALRSIESLQGRIRFEMHHKGRETIAEMVAMESPALDVPRMTVKLEDISRDSTQHIYVAFLSFLGFRGAPLSQAVEICVKQALWSMDSLPAHSRGGVDESWKAVFTPELHAEFEELFGDAEAVLGYRRPPFPTAGSFGDGTPHLG